MASTRRMLPMQMRQVAAPEWRVFSRNVLVRAASFEIPALSVGL